MISKIRIKISLSVFFIVFFAHTAFAAQFMVTRVIDGNTVKARSISKEITIRLCGIDAPETSRKKNQLGQPYSRKARDYLTHLVLNKMVKIEEYGKDRYRRVLAVIYVDDMNVNLRMVQVGLAEAYKGRPAKGFNPGPYRYAEQKARYEGINMWTQGDKYISPKEWRKQQKE
jgi:endonuclease YncB( thermonuclease family)